MRVHVQCAALAVALYAACASPVASAQPVVTLGAGFTVPVEPEFVVDGRTMGAGFSAGVAVPIVSSLLLRTSADVGSFALKQGAADNLSDGRTLVLTADAQYVTGSFDALIRPYALAGFGYSRVWDLNTVENVDQGAFSVSPGGGVLVIVASGLGVFGEARYVLGFTTPERSAFATFRAGIAFSTR